MLYLAATISKNYVRIIHENLFPKYLLSYRCVLYTNDYGSSFGGCNTDFLYKAFCPIPSTPRLNFI